MDVLQRKYIVDENNKKVGVQLDIQTFQKIEEIMENYALFHLMKETEKDDLFDLKSANKYYSKLEKINLHL